MHNSLNAAAAEDEVMSEIMNVYIIYAWSCEYVLFNGMRNNFETSQPRCKRDPETNRPTIKEGILKTVDRSC